MLVGIWAASGGGYFWPIWPILGWGIGLGCHAAPLLAMRSRRAPSLPAPAHQPARWPPPHPLAETSVDEVASSVAAERPSLRPAAAPDGTVTILFTDIEGSTALTMRVGDLRAMGLIRAHDAIVRTALGTHGGQEVKHTGDGIMASFTSVAAAVQAALAIQNRVAERNSQATDALQLRVGVSCGEPVTEEGDLFGVAVELAARLCASGNAGGILVSSAVREVCLGKGFVFEDRGSAELKGFSEPVRLYGVRAQTAP